MLPYGRALTVKILRNSCDCLLQRLVHDLQLREMCSWNGRAQGGARVHQGMLRSSLGSPLG